MYDYYFTMKEVYMCGLDPIVVRYASAHSSVTSTCTCITPKVCYFDAVKNM